MPPAANAGTDIGARPAGTATGSDELDLPAIIHIFTHRHTKALYSIQANALLKIIRFSKKGLRLPDLADHQVILEHALKAIDNDNPEAAAMIDPACHLIRLHGQPFAVTRAYEEIEMSESISDSFQIIGRCLKSPNEFIALAATDAIENFLNHSKQGTRSLSGKSLGKSSKSFSPTSSLTSTSPTNAKYKVGDKINLSTSSPQQLHHDIIAHSGVVVHLIDSLEAHSSNPKLSFSLVKAIKDVSLSPICAKQLIAAGFFDIVSLLLDQDARSPQVDVVLELIRNLIMKDPEATKEFNSEVNIRVLMVLLQQLLTEGHRAQDKELRNDILIILSLVARISSNRPNLARTSCLRTLLLYSTYSELLSNEFQGQLQIQSFTQSTEPLDLEMKLLMWSIACQCIQEQFCLAQIVQAELLRALFMYIDLDHLANDPVITRWSYTNLLQIQKVALRIITQIAVHMPEQFRQLDGVRLLVNFQKEVVSNPENLVERQLAAKHCRELQSLALQALVAAAGSRQLPFSEEQSGELFGTLLDVFSDHSQSLLVQANAINVVAMLCQTEDDKRTFRKEGGLQAVMGFLNDSSKVQMAVHREPKLLSSIVECVWNAVVGNKRNEAYFLIQDGMDSMLHLLHVCPKSMRKQVLGCIADVLANKKASSYFHEWRGTGGVRAIDLIVEMWENGDAPASPSSDTLGASFENDSEATASVTVDMKPVIYAVLSGVGFQSFSYASPNQLATLKTVESYPAVTRGQKLSQLQQDLQEQEAILPVESDSQYLDKHIQESQQVFQTTSDFSSTQLELQASVEQKNMDGFYKTIHDRATQGSTAPKKSKSSNYSIMKNRLAAKDLKATMIANSLDTQATLKKTAGSGAKAAKELREGDEVDDPEFEAKRKLQLRLQEDAEISRAAAELKAAQEAEEKRRREEAMANLAAMGQNSPGKSSRRSVLSTGGRRASTMQRASQATRRQSKMLGGKVNRKPSEKVLPIVKA